MIDALIDRFCAEMQLRKITKVRLAAMVGLHKNTLLHMGRPEWSPSVDTLRRIERGLFPNGIEGFGLAQKANQNDVSERIAA